MPLGLLLWVALSHDAVAELLRRYQPPDGVNGYVWSTPLRAFARLAPEPVYVQTASSPGKVTRLEMQCVPVAGAPCDLERSLRTLDQRIEGQGFHLLAEYFVESQGFRFPESGALLYPVFYQFCTRWGGVTGAVPDDIQERMSLCGVRFLFRSAAAAELRTAKPGPTNYDLIYDALRRLHGPPDGHENRGRVTIETDGESAERHLETRFATRRWCGLQGSSRKIVPACTASIVLAFDPHSGWGVLMYVTGPVWEFAYARHRAGVADDPLYSLLHDVDRDHVATEICTATHLCRPGSARAMSEERRALFRLPAASTAR